MEDLMARFTQTNIEHQHLMNDNIRLVAQIRKRKKEEVRKIKDQQKTRFKRKVKNLKKTIMMQSKVGATGETILRNSVLDKQFDKYSVAEDPTTPVPEQNGFFDKLRESMMIFTPNDPRNAKRAKKSRSPRGKQSPMKNESARKMMSPGKGKYDFRKKKGSQRARVSPEIKGDDESQIIERKRFGGEGTFGRVKMRSRINNLSDASDDSVADLGKETSMEKKRGKSKRSKSGKSGKSSKSVKNVKTKKIGSKRFSPDKKLRTGKPIQPSKTEKINRKEEGAPDCSTRFSGFSTKF